MIKRYFIVEKEEAEKLKTDIFSRMDKMNEELKALIEETGFDDIILYTNGFRYFGKKLERKEIPQILPDMTKPKTEWIDGVKYAAYRPKKNTKAGKEILKKLNKIPYVNYSKEVVKHFNVNNMVSGADSRSRTGFSLYTSGAGYIKNTMFVVIPWGDKEKNPEIPSCFKEIKKSEYIALTEE